MSEQPTTPSVPVPYEHPITLTPDELGPAERLTLGLARLTAWKEDPADLKAGWTPRVRSWKGYAFWCLKRLSDAGMIQDRNGTKTLVLTDDGLEFAEQFLTEVGIAPRALQTRALPPRPPASPEDHRGASEAEAALSA
jgi:hypothetical protein